MSAEDFLDTNVFVCLFDETAPDKRQRAERLVRRSLDAGSGCISTQVVQETLNVVTRKLGARPGSARLLLDDVLAPLWRVTRRARCTRAACDYTGSSGSAFTIP